MSRRSRIRISALWKVHFSGHFSNKPTASTLLIRWDVHGFCPFQNPLTSPLLNSSFPTFIMGDVHGFLYIYSTSLPSMRQHVCADAFFRVPGGGVVPGNSNPWTSRHISPFMDFWGKQEIRSYIIYGNNTSALFDDTFTDFGGFFICGSVHGFWSRFLLVATFTDFKTLISGDVHGI